MRAVRVSQLRNSARVNNDYLAFDFVEAAAARLSPADELGPGA